MQTKHVDVAIIGAGSAGLSARREVEVRGRSYTLIERGPHGTTCARVGCMPSKLLIAAADAAHEVAGAGRFGIRVPPGVRVDGRAVMERVRSERDRFVGFVLEAVDRLDEEQLLRGSARFVGPTSLEVDDHTRVEAKAVVVATGSSPFVPPSLDSVRDRVLVNDDVFELTDLPESILVLGSGVIGLELGQALHRLGVRVAILNPSESLGPLGDPVVCAKAREIFTEELDLALGVRDLSIAPHPEGGVAARWRDARGHHQHRFEWVLSAAGRRPNLRGLGLESLGVELSSEGVPPFDPQTTQVADLPIFLAGDANGERPLLHEASDEGRIAAANAAMWPELRAHVRRAPLAVVFTDPQIATVGLSHRELGTDTGAEGQVVVGQVSYDDQGRARVMGRNRGHVHIYVRRRDGLLLGAEMLGPAVEHTAHLLAWAVQQGMTVQRALQMPFYHPVVEEGIRTALRDAAYEMRLVAHPCAHELDCGPGA